MIIKHKRLVCVVVLLLVFSLAFSCAAFAANDDSEDDGGDDGATWYEKIFNSLADSTALLKEVFGGGQYNFTSGDELLEAEEQERLKDNWNDITDALWDGATALSDGAKAGGDLFFNFGTDDSIQIVPAGEITAMLLKVFTPLGYAFFLVSWAVGVSKQSISLELFDGKKLVEVGVQMITGMVFIGLSSKVCVLTDKISGSIARSLDGAYDYAYLSSLREAWSGDNVWGGHFGIFGWFLRTSGFFKANRALAFVYIALWIAGLTLVVTLAIRAIKLAILQGVAPLFFGFVGGEPTKQYFKNFIVQYSLLSFKIVFIVVIQNCLQLYMQSFVARSVESGGLPLGFAIFGVIIMITLATMINKSDEMFEKIFFGRGGM